LEHTAGSLIGINSSQTFNNFIGVGANGKSTFISLIERQWRLFYTLLVTQNALIGGGVIEIAGLKGVHMLLFKNRRRARLSTRGL
jgi:hypothetical protein